MILAGVTEREGRKKGEERSEKHELYTLGKAN